MGKQRTSELGLLKRRRRTLLRIIEAQEYYNKHNPQGYIPATVFYKAHGLYNTISYYSYLRWLSTPAKRKLRETEAQIKELEQNINN
jgi:hypothetical protein